MNQRIYNPPLAKAGEPTPADAQATATVRIPNVTATGNQLSSLIRNLNELKTDDAKINTRIELARARLEELKGLIQTEPLSAATKDKDGDRERIDTESAKDEGEVSDFVPSMHTIPTIVYRAGQIILGWAEVTYGKVEKPKTYDVTDDDLYHIFVRIYWGWGFYDLRWYRDYPDPPYAVLDQDTLEFPVPSSNYVYLSSFTRSGTSASEEWYMCSPNTLGGAFENFYTEGFEPADPRPGADKTVNIAMMLRGRFSVERKNIGESEDTAVHAITKMFPAGVGLGSFPIHEVWGEDPLRPGTRDTVTKNFYEFCSDLVIFCTAQDIKEFNELAERHPDKLYKIPLID